MKAIELVDGCDFAAWVCGKPGEYFVIHMNGDYRIEDGDQSHLGEWVAWASCYDVSQEYIDAQLKPFATELADLDQDLTLPGAIEYATYNGGFKDLFKAFKWLLLDSLTP